MPFTEIAQYYIHMKFLHQPLSDCLPPNAPVPSASSLPDVCHRCLHRNSSCASIQRSSFSIKSLSRHCVLLQTISRDCRIDTQCRYSSSAIRDFFSSPNCYLLPSTHLPLASALRHSPVLFLPLPSPVVYCIFSCVFFFLSCCSLHSIYIVFFLICANLALH